MDLLDLYVKITAQDEASASVDEISSSLIGKLGNAAATAAKALAGTFAVKKVVDFGKAAFDSYSQFEQLEGGVAKLYGNANQSLDEYLKAMESSGKSVDELTQTYQRNEEAQKLMMQQATEAWRTAGVDANTYMEQATSMSAALINSLGGDTVKAAKQTDVAMRAISDNVNTFGTDMASVSQAFLGFSKQNYTMLDNLKLGYGGTKEEMERLIKDANEWGAANGKASDLSIDSFSDVVTAIEQIQEKQGIAGTTAKEAMGTIEGSMNATKAAWQNLVTEFGKPDADIGARVSDLVDGIFGIVDEKTGKREGGLFKNVTSEVGVIATNMVRAVGQGVKAGFDWLMQNGPQMARSALQSISSAVWELGSDLVNMYGKGEGLDLIRNLFGSGEEIAGKVAAVFAEIVTAIQEALPTIAAGISLVTDMVALMVQEYGPIVLSKIGEILNGIATYLIENGPTLIATAYEVFLSFIEWLTSMGPELVAKVAELVGMALTAARDWIVANGPLILEAIGNLLSSVFNSIAEHGPTIRGNIAETIGMIVGYIAQAAADMLSATIEFMGGLITGTSEEGEKVRQWFADLPGRLLDALGDLGSLLWDAGSSIISGLWDGMSAVADDLFNWVSGIADTIASLKGPLPYDRKVLIENGAAIMGGLRRGLEGGFESEVMPYVSGMADAMQRSIDMQAVVSPTVGVSAAAVSQTGPATVRDDAVVSLLTAILSSMPEGVYLDRRTLVGQLAPDINLALGSL